MTPASDSKTIVCGAVIEQDPQVQKPLFELRADETITRTRATYAERGAQYGDTWRDAQWLTLKAVAKRYGVVIPDEVIRCIAAAVLCDVKYARQMGGYKDDTVIDAIAYNALLAAEVAHTDTIVSQLRYPAS